MTGVAYSAASIEFRMVQARYLKDLQYRAGVNTLHYHQMEMLLMLLGADHEQDTVDSMLSGHKRMHARLLNSMELATAKRSAREIAAVGKEHRKRKSLSDRDKMAYLDLLNQDNPKFRSLQDIIDRISKVGAK